MIRREKLTENRVHFTKVDLDNRADGGAYPKVVNCNSDCPHASWSTIEDTP
jgi:hypothetical protein